MTAISLNELAEKIGAEFHGDGDTTVSSIAGITSATKDQITFLSSSKYRKHLIDCQAAAVILTPADLPYFLENAPIHNALVMKNPYLGYAFTAQLLDTTPPCATDIAPSAYISPTATLGQGVAVGHNAVIEDDVILGDNVQIGAGSVVGKGTHIGANTKLWANVTIYHGVVIGESCLFQSGCIIGGDGFGYGNQQGKWVKIPQLGGVVIGDRVEVGACTCIDRGAIESTIIADGVIIDNLCQIAHNVVIGENTAVAGGTIMAGSLTIGKNCAIGGASVFNGHMEIADGVTVTGMAMVSRPLTKPGVYSSGIPVMENFKWRKMAARAFKLDEMHSRIKALEKKLFEKIPSPAKSSTNDSE